ncbi:MAG: polyprenyl synthetase family protein [Bacteroidales bacterium]|nr:polyprenyl synthetase family protein [Bacteroidales bacterium]
MTSVEKIQDSITKFIESQDFTGTPAELYAPIAYTMNQKGKRMRPTLCLLACEMFGGDIEECLTPAVAAEIFHNFTLIHDDIMDEAPLRRGLETVYHKWNSNIALLSGDTMLIKAFQYAMRTGNRHSSEILNELVKVALEVCEGQQHDLNFETSDDVTLEQYIEMIRLKTAVLLGSVLRIGAIVAGASDENKQAVYDFGIDLGIAFQLQDDLFDCYGDVKVFGKMPGGDIADNKKTYLYLKALQLASADDKALLNRYFTMPKGRDDSKMKAVLDIYAKYNVRGIVTDLMTEYYENAVRRLNEIALPEERKAVLREYAKYLYTRVK